MMDLVLANSSWNFTMLAVHLLTLFVILALVIKSPDWTQRFVMASLFVGYVFYTMDSGLQVLVATGRESEAPLWRIATAFEHVAVILGVWRIWLKERDRKCRNSLEHYRSSGRSLKSSV